MNVTHFVHDHVIERLLDLRGWRPSLETFGDLSAEERYLEVLGRAHSHLELMYLLSIVHLLEVRSVGSGIGERIGVKPIETTLLGVRRPALWLVHPWGGFFCARCGQAGPSGLILIPQLSLNGASWDLGILTTDDNGTEVGRLFALAEFDGYTVHRQRRAADAGKRRRMVAEGVPVIVAYEEQHPPATWFDAVIHLYLSGTYPEAASCPGFRAAEVYVPTAKDAA